MNKLKAIKGNKAYTVNSQEEKERFIAQGFDIYENDKLIENGFGKGVSLKQYESLKSEVSTLKDENATLKKENGNLEKEIRKFKVDSSGAVAKGTKE